MLIAVQVPIPEHMDLYHLHQEAEPSGRTALESVVVCCGPQHESYGIDM